ncbi:MAG TPA: hypothetical protein VKU41_00120 [Polyangiaceae bacterium]|nr:hypothetical protein [Polyangiaceae bacterium]
MTIRGWAPCVVAVVLAGCSSPGTTTAFGGGAGAGSSSSGSGNGAANGGAASGGSSASGSEVSSSGTNLESSGSAIVDAGPKYSDAPVTSLYDSGPPDAAGQQSITLTMDSFTVMPGDEVYKCQQFGNPFNGKNVFFSYYEGKMSAGSHHFFLFNMDATTARTQAAPLGDCPGKGIEFHPFPYLSQQANWNVGYPEPGMAYPFISSNGLMINVHYLNSGSTPLTAQVSIKITLADPSSVKTNVGSIFLNNTFFSVPANTPMTMPVTETKSYTPLQTDFQIFTSWSHMHRTALKFTASANSNVFYTETNWDSPQLFVHAPYLSFKAGTSITWSCDYYNDTSSALSFGDSAISNVMCIYIGQYFPADANNPDVISVLN